MFHGVCRAASCEITVQISPWQSGSYSASLYSRLSRSGVASFPPRPSHRVSRYYLSLLCAPCALQHAFPPCAEATGQTGADSRTTAVSGCVRSVKFRLEGEEAGVQQVCCALGMESGMPPVVSLHTDNCDAFRRITPALQPCSLREREREEIRIGRTFFS